jgi:hypothetical protein
MLRLWQDFISDHRGGNMQAISDITKRRFLLGTGLRFLAAASMPGWVWAMETGTSRQSIPERPSPGFNPDVELELVARKNRVSILPGEATEVMQYVGRVIKARAAAY